jgi:hypothetical protein
MSRLVFVGTLDGIWDSLHGFMKPLKGYIAVVLLQIFTAKLRSPPRVLYKEKGVLLRTKSIPKRRVTVHLFSDESVPELRRSLALFDPSARRIRVGWEDERLEAVLADSDDRK